MRHISRRERRRSSWRCWCAWARPILVQRALDEMDEDVRATGAMRVVLAELRLAQDDPEGAAAARWRRSSTALRRSGAAVGDTGTAAQGARRATRSGDAGASSRALERALEVAEPDGLLLPFLLHPTPELLERHRGFGPLTPG